MEDYEKIMKQNEEYLDIFEKELQKTGLEEDVIIGHVDRVEYYINNHMLIGIPRKMEEGCSLEVISFIEYKVNQKTIPADVNNVALFTNSIILFYKCMCDKGYVSLEAFTEMLKDIKDNKDEMIEDFYEKNPVEIKLDDIINAIEISHDYGQGFINIKSGEIVYIPDDRTFSDINDEEIEELYYKVESMNWEKVPEYRDYDIMTNFAKGLKNKYQSEELLNILHNKKAYRRFKDALYEMRLEDKYYGYYDQVIAELAQNWKEEFCCDEYY